MTAAIAAAFSATCGHTRGLEEADGPPPAAVLRSLRSRRHIAESFAAYLERYGVSSGAAEPLAIGVVVLILTFLSLVIGELVRKRIALAHADAIATRLAPIVNLIAPAAHPLVAVLQWATESAGRLPGVGSGSRTAVTDEEINSLIAEGTR